MHWNIFRQIKASAHKHGWPEQVMKIDYVLADDVANLRFTFNIPISFPFFFFSFQSAPVDCRRNVTNWRVEPNIEIFVFLSRNFEAKVWAISGNAPVFQSFTYPVFQVVYNLWLEVFVAVNIFC